MSGHSVTWLGDEVSPLADVLVVFVSNSARGATIRSHVKCQKKAQELRKERN